MPTKYLKLLSVLLFNAADGSDDNQSASQVTRHMHFNFGEADSAFPVYKKEGEQIKMTISKAVSPMKHPPVDAKVTGTTTGDI